MSDPIPLIPAKDVPRGIRPIYVVGMVVMAIGSTAAGTYVSIRTASSSVAKADAEAESAQIHLRRSLEEARAASTNTERANTELQRANTELSEAKRKAEEAATNSANEIQKNQLEITTLQENAKEARDKAATAAANLKAAMEAATTAALKNQQLQADIKREAELLEKSGTELKQQDAGYKEQLAFLQAESRRQQSMIVELQKRGVDPIRPTPVEPTKPVEPTRPAVASEVKAGQSVTVTTVIGPGTLFAESTGTKKAAGYNSFNSGEAVVVLSRSDDRVEIGTATRSRAGWLPLDQIASHLSITNKE